MIAGRDKATYHKAWLALAKGDATPAATAALAAAIVKKLPVNEVRYLAPDRDRKRHAPFLQRIAALAARSPDAAIARALAGVLEDPPFFVENCAGVFGPVLELVLASGDASALDRLRALRATPRASTVTMRAWLASVLPSGAPRGSPKPRAAAGRDLGALLRECLASPADDAPRTVYADALLEAGDPRGEFIQLQLRGEDGATLLRKHEKTWLGDVARITKLRSWRRGFLDEAELLQGAVADAATWKRLARDPALASVRVLVKGKASEALYRTFVMSPALAALREVSAPSLAMLRELAKLGHPLDLLSTLPPAPGVFAALDAIDTRGVAFDVPRDAPAETVARVRAWRGRTKLTTLVASVHFRAATAWYGDLAAWLFAFDELGVRRLGIAEDEGTVVVERTPAGLAIDARLAQQALLVGIASVIDEPVARLTVRGTPRSWAPPTAAWKRTLKQLAPKRLELLDGWR